jgi:hypothetical protein
MTPIVSLQAVVEEMDALSDEAHAFLNKRTGELVTITNEEMGIAEEGKDIERYPDWQKEMIRKAQEVLESGDYLPLPSKFDIHEYAIVQSFCYSMEDEDLRDELLGQIRGTGAFRRFKEAIDRHGIKDDWFRFREAALEEIAVEWLEENNIPYRRDK